MRKTLHEYVIESWYDNKIENNGVLERIFYDALEFAKLTNREPKLGDFIPCDLDGNVLEEPNASMEKYNHYNIVQSIFQLRLYESDVAKYQAAKERVIFKGDWEVKSFHEDLGYYVATITDGKKYVYQCFDNGQDSFIVNLGTEETINRIEDLPKEIEFKQGLI